MLKTFRQITIIGTGLLGASMGLALRGRGFQGRIVGIGRRQATVDRARELGCIDTAATDLSAADGSDLIVLATPIRQFQPVLEQLGRCQLGEAVITDVGSTKSDVCALAQQHLPRPQRFVGSHPMAGSEQHGPDAALANLFAGKPCIVTPDDTTDPDAVALVESLWTALGMKVMRLSPQEHDRKAALISHLPHLAAVLLVELASRGSATGLASSGFADTTRVASGDPKIWTDVFASNRPVILHAIDDLADELARVKSLIADGRFDDLHDWLARNQQARDAWVRTRNSDV